MATNVAAQAATFSITDTKHYVPVVILLTQDNAKVLEQLKSGFKRTINWNKYQTKVSTKRVNRYLDFLIEPSFQGVNRLLVLPFKDEAHSLVPSASFRYKRKAKKRPWNTSNT